MLIDLSRQLTWSLTIIIEIRNIKCVIRCCVHHTRDIMSISFEFCYGFSIILRMIFKLCIFWKIGLSTLDCGTWKIVTRMRNISGISFFTRKKSGFIKNFEQYRSGMRTFLRMRVKISQTICIKSVMCQTFRLTDVAAYKVCKLVAHKKLS